MGDSATLPSELPFLSPAEWRIFSLVSKKGPITVRQLVAELEASSEPSRSYTTILTLAQRLAAKEYLVPSERATAHGPGSAITYSASVPYVEALRRHAERFLSQYALGDPEDLSIITEVLDQHRIDR